jgi:hypothetical protein
LANPHLVFGFDNKDSCDLAKENGLDKRFFAFAKCNGENKIYPQDRLLPATDHRKEVALATMDFARLLEKAKQLDAEAAEGSTDWIHDELKDGLDNYDAETAKKFNNVMKSNRYDMLADLTNTKKKVE